MAIILDLDAYRVETRRENYQRSRGRRVPTMELRITRKSDGAHIHIEQNDPYAFAILWERAHGTPRAEMAKWVQDLIDFHEEQGRDDADGDYWKAAEERA